MQHMLQIRNDFEITELLRKQPAHLRLIASELKLIPSTVMRILNRMQDENVVDFHKEGKNNKYFLKDSPESLIYLYLTEHYKLLKILEISYLRRIIKEISEIDNQTLKVLFGSQANKVSEKSDIDIFIETEDNSLRDELSKISSKLSIKIGRFEKNSDLGKEIIKNHIIIHNIERFYQLLK